MSCGDTCQIWTWYSIANMYFGDVEKLGKWRNGGNRLSNPQPWPAGYVLRPYSPWLCNDPNLLYTRYISLLKITTLGFLFYVSSNSTKKWAQLYYYWFGHILRTCWCYHSNGFNFMVHSIFNHSFVDANVSMRCGFWYIFLSFQCSKSGLQIMLILNVCCYSF